MHMRTSIAVVAAVLLLAACTKQAGEGGAGRVHGRVVKEIRLVMSNPGTVVASYAAPDEEVWIQYGESLSPDDRVHTNYDGEFEFEFLRRGEYTVYVYSEDTTGAQNVSPDRMAIKRRFTIDGRKDAIDLGDITIYERP